MLYDDDDDITMLLVLLLYDDINDASLGRTKESKLLTRNILLANSDDVHAERIICGDMVKKK